MDVFVITGMNTLQVETAVWGECEASVGGTYRRGVAAPQSDVVRVETTMLTAPLGGDEASTHLVTAGKRQAAVGTVLVARQGAVRP